jgi:hypothetical protein
MRQLKQELRGYETALKSAGLRPNSISTSVDGAERFLRWLDGDYVPRGPVSTGTSKWSRPTRSSAAVERQHRSHGTPGRVEVISQTVLAPFESRGPSGQAERYDRGWELEVKTADATYVIRHALTRRTAFGRERLRSVTWVNGYPAVEGTETDGYASDRTLVSLLKINGRQHVTKTSEVPPGYQGYVVVPFDDVVSGPNAHRSLAVQIREDDVAVWARHAILRHRAKAR